ncbi:protein POLLENLESS 3-like [Salvia miltiorrhiza]|uniref:protein POLLENLESS 3-like n=1 Tax=Salvia miltiorrhiza TaxID=226208 RepID=UPI0025ACF6FB|nr:protein POLLENLESS 3-like [Salvia miltiorrhiza]XP_057763863.1 protein POLLENLESS 3-like [Salvia miltiorrhiza]
MLSSSCVDNSGQPRGFLTPPPTWKTQRRSPVMPRSETKPQLRQGDLFHVVHKIPSGDSPYVRAKHVQLVDKDPSRAISLFWQAINAGDRVDSALKDMAVVMKQLNRSDEAIEAIKSFRHLSPPDSQESLDNILVELYKQSGRMEEEIELLQYKLKQVEEGMAFSGRKTKTARSQGKKVQITVQKEYSRLLGNLAWAYMQQKDFKPAEENYRKALSFEADKNKQCNLAVCLMHMNKLTEAKFLLESIPSDSGAVDESYLKSYERACEILAEFESQRGLKPTKQMEHNNESGMARGFADGHLSKTKPFGGRFCSQSQRHSNDSNGALSSPLPSSAKTSKGTSTDFAYEKRADFDWRANHYEPNVSRDFSYRNTPKVPLTQPRRCTRYEDQRKAGLAENANGGYCRKLSFGSSASSETAHSFASQNVDYFCHDAPDEMPNILPQFLGKRNASAKPSEANEQGMDSLAYGCKKSSADFGTVEGIPDQNPAREIPRRDDHHKSWADMVEEEDEQEFGSWRNNYPKINLGKPAQKSSFSDKFSVSVASMDQEGFNDENMDSNVVPETPKLHDPAEEVSREMGTMDLGGGYLSQPEKNALSKNHQPLRRSLCFDQKHKPDTPSVSCCASPLTTKALNFEGQAGGGPCVDDNLGFGNSKSRRRLPVFEDITRFHSSPRR